MEISFLPIDGVGLARIEFIISDHIKCHPMALLHPEKVDKESNEKIAKLIRGTVKLRHIHTSKAILLELNTSLIDWLKVLE